MPTELDRLEDQMKVAQEATLPGTYISAVSRECWSNNTFLYHTTTPERVVKILLDKDVRNGEFSTHNITGLGWVAIRFWKKNLFEKGVRPVWWWSEDAPHGFIPYGDQYTQVEECGWVQEGRGRGRIFGHTIFDYDDIHDVVVWNRLSSIGSRSVRNQLRANDIPVKVVSGRKASGKLYVPRARFN
jgi:hypothetical protein